MADLDFYYPFDSVSGDRKTVAATERAFFNALFADGVVGANAFNLSTTSAGVYSIGAGVAIIGGAIGGIKTAKSVTAQPAQGASLYIVLRLDTRSSVRKITLETTATLLTATAAQLDAGARADLALYKVQNVSGSYGVLDQRTYCTSFDAAIFEQEYRAALEAIETLGNAELNAIVDDMQSIVDAAAAQAAGLYGGAARQGFINPCFTVNQRGRSSYGLTSGSAYTFDRWLARAINRPLTSAMLISTEQDGARHALKIETQPFVSTGGNTARAGIMQNIEGGVRQFCAGGRKFTVSFDAKASAACYLGIDVTEVAQTGGAQTLNGAQTKSLTTSWQRFTATFQGKTAPTAAQVQDVLQVAFWVAWIGYDRYSPNEQAGGHTVYIANLQINEGDSALPCLARSYAEELALCQRYYARFGAVTLVTGGKVTATNKVITAPLPLPCRMAKEPTITVFDRVGSQGFATIEDIAGIWRSGLAYTVSSESPENPVFAVTDIAAGEVSRVAFSRVDVDAELMD